MQISVRIEMADRHCRQIPLQAISHPFPFQTKGYGRNTSSTERPSWPTTAARKGDCTRERDSSQRGTDLYSVSELEEREERKFPLGEKKDEIEIPK